jgi:hypothetical protein
MGLSGCRRIRRPIISGGIEALDAALDVAQDALDLGQIGAAEMLRQLFQQRAGGGPVGLNERCDVVLVGT